MKKLAIVALKCVQWSVIFLVAVIGLVAAATAFDEDLHPDAAAYLKPEAPAGLPDDQNAWFAFIGLGAPEAEESHAAGHKWAGAVRDVAARRSRGENATWPQAVASRTVPELCSPEKNSCLAIAREKEGEARKIVAGNAQLLARYRALLGYPGFAETQEFADPGYPIPPLGTVVSAQRVFHVDAALRIAQGETDAVLADLEKEIAFLRRMIAGTNMLITKMLGQRLLLRSTLMASDVLARHREAAAPRAAALAQALRPLTAEERQLGAALRHEFRIMKGGFELMLRYPGLSGESSAMKIWRLFYAPNATANMERPFRKAVLDAAAAPAARLAAAYKQVTAPPAPSWWTYLYNPVGKMIVQISYDGNPYESYIATLHDLDGAVRLVALQAEIVAKGVKDEDVPQFLSAADKRYANPWTEQTMQWDAAARRLYFEPRSKRYRDDKVGGTAGRVGVAL